jgi:hypothetical protein
MEMKKVLAGWSKICPGCNIGRKYPDSFIGKKVRDHWEKGCTTHDAYVERCTAVKSLHRTKARRHPTTNEFNVCSAMILFSLAMVVVRVSRTVWGVALSLPAKSKGPRDYSHREVPCTVTGIVSSSLRLRYNKA